MLSSPIPYKGTISSYLLLSPLAPASQCSLHSSHIRSNSCAALQSSSSQVLAHHRILGRHSNPNTHRGGGGALLPSPLLLWCWSRCSDSTTSSTHAISGTDASCTPFRRWTPEEGMGRPVVLAGISE